jgi:signal transduction histidine kinase
MAAQTSGGRLRQHPDELFDFKRIFTLMLGLVVLPTLLLSGFGILAIMNERAALEKRLRETYAERAGRVEQTLLRRLADGSVPPSAEVANRLLPGIVLEMFPEEDASFAVVPGGLADSGERSLTEMLRSLSGNWATSAGLEADYTPTPIAVRELPAPLLGFRLVAYVSKLDPVRDKLLRNTIIYSSLMALFLALVIVGVSITARFIHREISLSRLQTDFVSNISHELRTPLTSIRMFIETLQLGRVKDEAEVQECLAIIAAESERLTRLIERILGWARMEAGRRIYHFETVEPGELLARALQAFRTQSLQADFELTTSVEPNLPRVSVDVEAMNEALLNLLNNALKYTGTEKKLGARVFASRGLLAIEISDNGIGISVQDRKRIFDRFYRADALLSRKTEGSGLGLSIVRHVVEAHGGKVQVESELGVGSRFTIFLNPVVSPTHR